MKCNHCGYFNQNSNNHCEMCGTALTPSSAPVPEETTVLSADSSPFTAPEQNYQQSYAQPDYSQQSFQPAYQQAQPYQSPASVPSQTADKDPGQVIGIVALILGIITVLAQCCSSFLIPGALALPFAIAAIVCGAIGMKKSKAAGKTNVMAIIGLVLGILNLIGAVVALLSIIIFGGAAIGLSFLEGMMYY